MKTYTYSEARQRLATLLDQALRDTATADLAARRPGTDIASSPPTGRQ